MCLCLRSQRYLSRSLKQLRARKLSKSHFERDCDVFFGKLLGIISDRINVRNKIDFVGSIQTVIWFSLSESTVSEQHLASALARYDGLEEALLDTHEAQRAVLRDIEVCLPLSRGRSSFT